MITIFYKQKKKFRFLFFPFFLSFVYLSVVRLTSLSLKQSKTHLLCRRNFGNHMFCL